MAESIDNDKFGGGAFVFNPSSEEMKPFEALTVNTEPKVEDQIKEQNKEPEVDVEIDMFAKEDNSPGLEIDDPPAEFNDVEGIDIFGKEDIEEEDIEEDIEIDQGLDSEIPQEEVENDEEVNIYQFMANQLKSDNGLPEDFEVTEKTTSQDIYDAYYNSIKEDAEAEITQNVYSQLANNGVTQEDLEYAKLLRKGVNPQLLHSASRYEHFANMDVEKADDSDIKDLVKQMYLEKNVTENAIKKLIDASELDDDLNVLAEEAKQYFGEKRNAIIKDEMSRAEREDAQRAEIARRQNEILTGTLKAGAVLGEKIPDVKDFKRALYERDQSIDINGQQYVASEYQLFEMEMQNNPEAKLWAFKKWKYRGNEEDSLKAEAEAKAEAEFLDHYKTEVEKSKKALNNKKLRNKLSSEKSTRISKNKRKDRGSTIIKI